MYTSTPSAFNNRILFGFREDWQYHRWSRNVEDPRERLKLDREQVHLWLDELENSTVNREEVHHAARVLARFDALLAAKEREL